MTKLVIFYHENVCRMRCSVPVYPACQHMARELIGGEKKEDNRMLYTTGWTTIGLVGCAMAAALFFCNVAVAPLVARRMCPVRKDERDRLGRRLVRFW